MVWFDVFQWVDWVMSRIDELMHCTGEKGVCTRVENSQKLATLRRLQFATGRNRPDHLAAVAHRRSSRPPQPAPESLCCGSEKDARSSCGAR